MGVPIWLWFDSGAVWGVVILCVPPSAALIVSNTSSVIYYELMRLLTLTLLLYWLITYYGYRLRAAELASSIYTPFKLGMKEASYLLTSELLGWVNLSGLLVV